LLFVREQVGGSVVRFSAQKGDKAVILELQGSLLFGTSYELSLRK
jgi:hypothetical protein